MESLARAGFSWHLNPGCLWYRSVSRLICQPFPHSAVGSEYLGTQGWGPGGEDGASQQFCQPRGMAHSVYPPPPHTSEHRDVCPFPEQSTGTSRPFQRGQCKVQPATACADLCPGSSFVALVPKFQSIEREEMETREKGPAWAHQGQVSC